MPHLKSLYLMPAIVALTTLPALAEMCDFTTECYEGEGCSETSFQAEIVGNEDGGALLLTDAESIPLSQGGSPDLRVYVGIKQTAFHLLTVSKEGPARYSTHLYDGPIMINYLGTCK